MALSGVDCCLLSDGEMADDDLYLLRIKNPNTEPGRWLKVPIEPNSPKPGTKYGLSIVYVKPFIVVFGGNVQNMACDEVWTMNVDVTPFRWVLLF